MTALAAVFVPGQIRQAADDPQRLDQALGGTAMLMPVAGKLTQLLVAIGLHQVA